jgi:serine/threonine protein kinase
MSQRPYNKPTLSMLAEGFDIGAYRIVSEIGRGGMASVYRAYQPSLDRFVAVKVMRDAGDESFRERFRREARTVARLRHPNIIQVYDFGEQADLVYLVMELIEGTTLRERMAGPMSAERALNVIAQLGAALDYAHASGVIHRDVKPGNVLIDSEERVMLGDFGIARLQAESGLTRDQSSLGTPEYMSPEQAAAELVGGSSDIYSLGIVAFQLLTGQVPFRAETAVAILHAHIHATPPPPSSLNKALSPAVDAVIGRALAKQPDERFASAAEFTRFLREAVDDDGEGPTLRTAAYHAPARTSGERDLRNWAALGLTTVVAALLLWFVGRPVATWTLRFSPLGAVLSRTSQPAASQAPPAAPTGTPIASAAPAELASSSPPSASGAAAPTTQASVSEPTPVATPTPFPSVAPVATPAGPNPPIHTMTATDGVHFGNEAQTGDSRGHLLSVMSLGPNIMRMYAADTETLRLRSFKSNASSQWTPEPAEVQGAPAGILYGSVVALPDGGFRLYYLPQNSPLPIGSGVADVLSARSSDGVHFVQEAGSRLSFDGITTVTVTAVKDGWLMLFRHPSDGLLAGARSPDGMKFTVDPNVALQAPAGVQVTSYDGAFHFTQYRFATNKMELLSSTDGTVWKLDQFLETKFQEGTGPSPSLIVKDAAGLYRMFFSWVRLPSSASPAASKA